MTRHRRLRKPGDQCLCTSAEHAHAGRCKAPVYGRNSQGNVLRICDACRAETYEARRKGELQAAGQFTPEHHDPELPPVDQLPPLPEIELPVDLPPLEPLRPRRTPGQIRTNYRTDMPPDDDEDITRMKF